MATTLSIWENTDSYTDKKDWKWTKSTDIKPCYRPGGFTLKGKINQSVGLLTDCIGIVDLKAAEHLVDVPGMEKTVPPHHHLERLWLHDTYIFTFKTLPSKITFDTTLYMKLVFMSYYTVAVNTMHD